MDQSTNRTALRGLSWVCAVAAFGLAACGPEREVRVQPAPGESFILNDAESASIMSTANTAEIQEGQLALQKSRNDAVRQFAQRMVSDHTALNQELMAHMRRHRGTSGANPITNQLQSNTQQTTRNLQQLEGMQFDRAYIENQIAMHQWLLNTLDNALIPGADDKQLEADLREARDVIASHLQHARQVQSSLGR